MSSNLLIAYSKQKLGLVMSPALIISMNLLPVPLQKASALPVESPETFCPVTGFSTKKGLITSLLVENAFDPHDSPGQGVLVLDELLRCRDLLLRLAEQLLPGVGRQVL